jgi:hypothetical protein
VQLDDVRCGQVARETAQYKRVGDEVWRWIAPMNNLNVVDDLLQGMQVNARLKPLKTF